MEGASGGLNGGTYTRNGLNDVRDDIARTAPRYVVTELEGYATTNPYGSRRHPGLSVHVVDVPFNHRVVGTWRSEDYGGAWRGRVTARHLANARCAVLNGEAPVVLRHGRFMPKCPRCGLLNPPRFAVCAGCDERLV